MAPRVLLTGASGFVGSHVRERMDCIPLGPLDEPTDLRDFAAVRAAVAEVKAERVIHLAAQAFVPRSFEQPQETFDVNFTGTLHLLQALEACGFKGRMLYVGSGDVYGLVPEAELPITESQPLRPRNPYAVSKVAAEALCYQWSQTGPFEIVMARPLNHIGARQTPAFAVANFASQIAAIRSGGRPPRLVVGDIDVTRDYLDVRDVVRAYELLLQEGRNGEVYNICSGVERTLRSILDAMVRLAGVEVTIESDPRRMRPSEQRRMRGSYGKLHQATGWQPQTPWEVTLRDVMNYWMEQVHG